MHSGEKELIAVCFSLSDNNKNALLVVAYALLERQAPSQERDCFPYEQASES